ncbi:unnamed protein product [Ectocarpus fasciculatus]
MSVSESATVSSSSATCKEPRLPIWSWVSTYIHVALDTFLLCGVLREKDMDERGADARLSNNNCNSIANSSGLVLSH